MKTKQCRNLPTLSPILKRLGSTRDGDSEGGHNYDGEYGISYQTRARKNVFEIRVFNGKLEET